jgi:hypothetical protein
MTKIPAYTYRVVRDGDATFIVENETKCVCSVAQAKQVVAHADEHLMFSAEASKALTVTRDNLYAAIAEAEAP